MGLHLGDSLDILKTFPDNSIDSVVTDPPYGWRFMGKAWDGADITDMAKRRPHTHHSLSSDGSQRSPREKPAEAAGTYDTSLTGNKAFEIWTCEWAKEVFRVLKPGGHMLVFCGPRTYHRMASGVEDAGFEIRDQLQWLFGSGFPKSQNIAIAIDKKNGALGNRGSALNLAGAGERTDIKTGVGVGSQGAPIHEPITEYAKKWSGWGTALKPANEPIVLARKPLSEKTVAANVLKWGTGGINIDACRIDGKPRTTHKDGSYRLEEKDGLRFKGFKEFKQQVPQGRFPANLILDEVAAEMLDEQSGIRKNGGQNYTTKGKSIFGTEKELSITRFAGDSGGAARFFYCAKTSKSERNAGLEGMPKIQRNITEGHGRGAINTSKGDGTGIRENRPCENHHPTVKPIKLMSYLCLLITPPDGTILDPFMGSGSTGVAARKEGFEFIGIEKESEYFEIAKRRINRA